MAKAEIGTISHATMRNEDLIPSFMSEIERLDPERAKQIRDEENQDPVNVFNWLENEDETEEPEYASDFVNDLFDVLNEYAPEYCYFGATEGDGSDYGFWPSFEAAEADNVLKVSEVPSTILHVNDHGNATLYSVEVKEIWAVV